MTVKMYVTRWIARITALIFGGGFVLLQIAAAIDSMVTGNLEPPEMNALVQLTVMLTGVVGLLLAWRWELAGGILSVVAFSALGVINPATIPFPLIAFLFPSVLFLITGWFGTTPFSTAETQRRREKI